MLKKTSKKLENNNLSLKETKEFDLSAIIQNSSNKKIKIEVSDQGIGIPKEEQAYIYDSFYRASNVGNIYGNGLGLLLAKNIIDLHRGEMIISSEEGKGTRVTLLLSHLY